MTKHKQVTGHYTGELTAMRSGEIRVAQTSQPISLLFRGGVNKVVSAVDSIEQSVHKLFRETFDICTVSQCFKMKICNMASLACIVQSPCSDRDFNRFTMRPRPEGMGEARNQLRRNSNGRHNDHKTIYE